MIETKEDFQQLNGMLADTIDEVDHSALLETIEALRKVARMADELRVAMVFNKGTGETKKRLESAYGALWRAKNDLPHWITEPEHE